MHIVRYLHLLSLFLFIEICMESGLQIMQRVWRCWRFSKKPQMELNMQMLVHLIAPQPVSPWYVAMMWIALFPLKWSTLEQSYYNDYVYSYCLKCFWFIFVSVSFHSGFLIAVQFLSVLVEICLYYVMVGVCQGQDLRSSEQYKNGTWQWPVPPGAGCVD